MNKLFSIEYRSKRYSGEDCPDLIIRAKDIPGAFSKAAKFLHAREQARMRRRESNPNYEIHKVEFTGTIDA